jgi:hypothetical protein
VKASKLISDVCISFTHLVCIGLDGCDILHVSSSPYPPMMATFCCGQGRCAYGSAKAMLDTAKFGGGVAAPLPHACISTLL